MGKVKKPLRGLKKQKCPPIIRWMGTGWGGDFDAEGSASYELTSTVQKCAEALRPHNSDDTCWYSGCQKNSCGIGLLVDQSQTPLFRCYGYDAYTNNRGEQLAKHQKQGVLYSTRVNDSGMVYVTAYNQVLSMIEKFVNSGYTEATIGDGKNPIKYSAVVVDSTRGSHTYKQAKELAECMGLPIIEMKDYSLRKNRV